MSERFETIQTPDAVQALAVDQLPRLADALRQVILETVGQTGGHLASNLGTVELTIALLRVFSPPRDKIVWDVGHQSYAWKLLTGRRGRFHTLRQHNGISGFPKPEESPCDAFVAGHAGTALSAATGMAIARDRQGDQNTHVIAIIGDASMSNGITLEALNCLHDVNSKVIIILNDNEMSISESVGAISRGLGRMLVDVRYNRIKTAAEAAGHRLHMTPLRRVYHRLEQAIKSVWLKNAFFEEFGVRYVGPIDGHDFNALHNAFCTARDYKHTVLIHVATQKGRGFKPAEREPSRWHGVGAFDLASPKTVLEQSYSKVFGSMLIELAEADPKILAVTAAMRNGTGLDGFAERFPERFFDVGICEAHAVVFAAGLAASGFRPVFAVYSTFLQRAVDCVMHDVCLQNLPVLFCIDRAGVVGSDGPTHHGIYDISMLRCLPNLLIMQPKDTYELCAMMKTAFAQKGPAMIRYPRDLAPLVSIKHSCEALPVGIAEVIMPQEVEQTHRKSIWFWALGDMVPLACDTAERLKLLGMCTGVVNARFIKPLDRTMLYSQAREADMIVTLENGAVVGGFGSAIQEALAEEGIGCPVVRCGWPDVFVAQGTTAQLLEDYGLTAQKLVKVISLNISIASAG